MYRIRPARAWRVVCGSPHAGRLGPVGAPRPTNHRRREHIPGAGANGRLGPVGARVGRLHIALA
eukprot:8426419-Pyramimonas_sp.AAC.1